MSLISCKNTNNYNTYKLFSQLFNRNSRNRLRQYRFLRAKTQNRLHHFTKHCNLLKYRCLSKSKTSLTLHQRFTKTSLNSDSIGVVWRLKACSTTCKDNLSYFPFFQFSREFRGLDVTSSEFTVRKVSNSLENSKESFIERYCLKY